MVGQQVVESHPAVDSGADHACPVGSFEVAAHDLVKFSVTQTLEYDC